MNTETLQERLRKRALIRSGITSRKSIQENKPDKLSEILIEAADNIQYLLAVIENLDEAVQMLDERNTRLNHEVEDLTFILKNKG